MKQSGRPSAKAAVPPTSEPSLKVGLKWILSRQSGREVGFSLFFLVDGCLCGYKLSYRYSERATADIMLHFLHSPISWHLHGGTGSYLVCPPRMIDESRQLSTWLVPWMTPRNMYPVPFSSRMPRGRGYIPFPLSFPRPRVLVFR